MKSLLLSILLLTVSNLSLAASVTLTWTGKVPSIGCTNKSISNKTELKTLQVQCYGDIQIKKKNNAQDKAVLAFNL